MLAQQEQRIRLLQQKRKLNPVYEEYSGINRRAVALFPGEEATGSQTAIALTTSKNIRQQLLNIEAQKLTCCLKVDSPKHKSRAALLTVNGRVLACAYGSTKLPSQIFGKKAYEKMMSEITHSDNIFTSYLLNENIVLAAGAMFHGKIIDCTIGNSVTAKLKSIVEHFEECAEPGSLALLNQQNRTVCIIYFSNGEIIGMRPLINEIKMRDFNSLFEYLRDNPETEVLASSLNFGDANLRRDFTFSLCGITEVGNLYKMNVPEQVHIEVARLGLLRSIEPVTKPFAIRSDRFIGTKNNVAPMLNKSIEERNAFKVDPLRSLC